MRKSTHILLLAVYLMVGYVVPLAHRTVVTDGNEAVRQKKGKTLPKSMRVRPLWKVVKHVPASQQTTSLELLGVITPASLKVYEHGNFLDDPIVQLITFHHSPFNSHLRAPPVG